MDSKEFAISCGIVATAATILNLFFIVCLMLPRRESGVTRHLPLRILLGLVVLSTSVHQIENLLSIWLYLVYNRTTAVFYIINSIGYFSYCAIFSCTAWISMFYHLMIVPQRHAIFIWMKKHIDRVIYSGLVLDGTLLLCGSSTYMEYGMVVNNWFTNNSLNTTVTPGDGEWTDLYIVSLTAQCLYFTRLLASIIFSSGSTYIYLRRHMKRMEESSSPFSQPQLQSQMMVTVTAMLQAALCLLSCMWTVIVVFLFELDFYQQLDKDGLIACTVSSVVGLCNSLCLGFSQSVFRQRFTALFEKASRALGFLQLSE